MQWALTGSDKLDNDLRGYAGQFNDDNYLAVNKRT